MKKILNISGLDVEVQTKKQKNIYLKVLPPTGKVVVTAPYGITDDFVVNFVKNKDSWIRKKIDGINSNEIYTQYKYIPGEVHYLWGKPYILKVIKDSKNYIDIIDEHIVLHIKEDIDTNKREEIFNNWYRKILKDALPDIIKKCENKTGVNINEFGVKNMKTKWGTCNIDRKRIWLNLQLAKKDPMCLEYVVTHEMVHLYERYHNKHFKDLMGLYFPDYKKAIKMLNK